MQGKTNHSDYYKRSSNGNVVVYSGSGRPTRGSGYTKRGRECFAKGTMVWKCSENEVIATGIEDIKEGDYVLSQHNDGQVHPELVIVKDIHE